MIRRFIRMNGLLFVFIMLIARHHIYYPTNIFQNTTSKIYLIYSDVAYIYWSFLLRFKTLTNATLGIPAAWRHVLTVLELTNALVPWDTSFYLEPAEVFETYTIWIYYMTWLFRALYFICLWKTIYPLVLVSCKTIKESD